MSEIFNPNYNSLPKQVEINRRDIEELKSIVKQAYSTTFEYGDSTGIVTIALTSTSIPLDTEVGAYDRYLITADGYLLETISISLDPETDIKQVNAQMVANIKGPAGERGLQGLPGEPGPAGPAGPAGTSFQITGYAESVAELPAVGQVGDAYAVGSADPKDIYVWVTSPQAEWVNLGSMQGPKGDTGETGLTPNITANASVGSGTGTPSVTVTKSGTDENPVLSFAFNNLKGLDGSPGTPGTPGLPGADGVTPDITMSASVSNTTGIPSVTVTKSGTTAEPVFSLAFENLKGDKGDKGDPGSGGEAVVTNHIRTNMELPNLVFRNIDKVLPNLPFQDYDITADIINMENYTIYLSSSKSLISEDGVNWKQFFISNRSDYNTYIGRNIIPIYGKDYAFIVDSGQLKVLYNNNGAWTFESVTTTLDITGDTLVNFDKTKFAYVYPDYLYMVSTGGNFYGSDLSTFDPTATTPQIDFESCTSSVSNIDPSKIWSTYKNSEYCIFYNDGTTDYYSDLYNESDITWNSFTWDNASISFNPQTDLKYCMVSGTPLTAVMLSGENYVPYVDPANQTFSWTQYNPDPIGGATIIGYQCFWTPQHIIWQNSNSSPYTYFDIDVQNNKATKLEGFGIIIQTDRIWTDGIYYFASVAEISANYVFKDNKWVQLTGDFPPQNKYRVGNLLMGNATGQTILYLFDPDTLTFSNTTISNNTGRAFDNNVFELFGNWYYTLIDVSNIRHVFKINVTLNNDVYEVTDTDVTASFSTAFFVGANVWKYNNKYYVYSSSNFGEITENNGTFTITWFGTGGFDKVFWSKIGVLGYRNSNHTFYKFNGSGFDSFYTLTADDLSLDSFSNFGPTIINDKLYFRDIEILTQLDLKYTN